MDEALYFMLKAEVVGQKNMTGEALQLFENANEILSRYENDSCRKIINFIKSELYSIYTNLDKCRIFDNEKYVQQEGIASSG